MFIVDFGVFAPAPVTPNSGKIWKVTQFAKRHIAREDKGDGAGEQTQR
jgi:hypothetical protein